MFAFEHFMEGDDPFGYTQPVNEKAYRMLEAKAKGGARNRLSWRNQSKSRIR